MAARKEPVERRWTGIDVPGVGPLDACAHARLVDRDGQRYHRYAVGQRLQRGVEAAVEDGERGFAEKFQLGRVVDYKGRTGRRSKACRRQTTAQRDNKLDAQIGARFGHKAKDSLNPV